MSPAKPTPPAILLHADRRTPEGALTTLLLGIEEAPKLPYASSLCGACMAACPVEINIPDMLLKLRRDLVKAGDPTLEWKAGMKLWQRAMQSPRLFLLGVKMAQAGTGVIAGKSGKIKSLPPPLNAWTNSRDFPAFPKESFRERMKKRKANQQASS